MELYSPINGSDLTKFLLDGIGPNVDVLRLRIGSHTGLTSAVSEALVKGAGAHLGELGIWSEDGLEVELQEAMANTDCSISLAISRPSLDNLRQIISRNEIATRIGSLVLDSTCGDDVAATLATSSQWGQLKKFQLSASYLTSQGVVSLTNSEWFNQLQYLDLHDNPLGDTGCATLAAAGGSSIQELDLTDVQCGSVGIRQMLGVEWKSLRRLVLHANQIGIDGCESIARTLETSPLEELDISVNGLSGDWLQKLAGADSKAKSRILKLAVGGNIVDSDGLTRLVAHSVLHSLREFDMYSCGFDDSLASNLSRYAGWLRLRILNLGNTDLTSQGLRKLVGSSWTKSLWLLALDTKPGLGNEILKTWANAEVCKNLVEFWVPSTVVDDIGAMKQLADSPVVRFVEFVHFTFTDDFRVFDAWLRSSTLRPVARASVENEKERVLGTA